MFLGAIAQSVPDVDFLATIWTSTSENLLAHRGFTHSILFALLVSPILGLLAERWRGPKNASWRQWTFFFLIQAGIHLLLDGSNVYGVGWFEPFMHHRFSYNWIFVADPLFSIWLGIAFVALLILRQSDKRRRWWIRFGVGMSMIYLLYCGLNKWKIDKDIRLVLANQEITYDKYFTTPTAFNNWLWYVVAENDSGYHIGYRSVFSKGGPIDFHFVKRNNYLMNRADDKAALNRLIRFSKGFYSMQQWHDTLVFHDLRFGQITGWKDPVHSRFAFDYIFHPYADNTLVVQRGRFAGWDKAAFLDLLKKIKAEEE